MFSDGIRPGGDLTDLDGSSERILPIRRQSRSLKKLSPIVNSKSYYIKTKKCSKYKFKHLIVLYFYYLLLNKH